MGIGADRDAGGWVTTLTEVTCPYARVMTIMFSILVVFIGVATASVLALSPGNDSYYVALMVIALDLPVALLLGVLLYLCRQYRQQY